MFNNLLGGPTEPNEYQKILMEIFTLVKFHNPSSLLNVTPEDLKDLAESLEQEYAIQIVRTAYQEIKSLHANKKLTLGVLLEKCFALRRAEENIIEIQTYTNQSREFGLEQLAMIKTKLAENQPKPYRHHIDPNVDPAWLNGPALYPKCLAANLIIPIEDIYDPKLKALYSKAWNEGLTLDEKQEFQTWL